jgi:excisionase family DNA binding protein
LLLTIEEAAERLQVGRCTMQALLLSGEVQSFKIGRLRRVPPGALEDYIARQMAR